MATFKYVICVMSTTVLNIQWVGDLTLPETFESACPTEDQKERLAGRT